MAAGKAALGRVKSAMKVQKIVKDLRGAVDGSQNEAQAAAGKEGAKDGADAGSGAGGTVSATQSNRQVQLLQDKIAEKEAKISKAKEVHQRMKKEFALLRY